MPKTVAPSPTDKRMWRRILARCHPDAGGAHELFLFAQAVKEYVTAEGLPGARRIGDRSRYYTPPPNPDDRPRVPYDSSAPFEFVTDTALRTAEQNRDNFYGELLFGLSDCYPLERMAHEQQRGASYRRLAAIGHMVGMDLEERRSWYLLAESIPLSDRHAGHLLSKLKRRAA